MEAIVKLSQGYRSIYFKFDDEMSAIQFATISKEHVMNPIDREENITKTLVSVILNPDKNDIEE